MKRIFIISLFMLYIPYEYTARTSKVDFYEEPELSLQADSLTPQIHNYFNKLVDLGFNGALLAAHNGKIIFRETSGFSDIQQKLPLETNSKFQLASVSKQFTAAAIMLLYDKGLLTFDDSVQMYFPNFPYKGITIKDLLHHRSGLPEYQYFNDSILEKQRPLNNNKIIQYFADQKPAKYNDVNVRFHYCNSNYVVLAAIVEKISGMDFPDFMTKYIFTPAGLKNTIIYQPDKRNTYTDLTFGHKAFGRKVEDNDLDEVYGDKGVYSTLNDLFIWDRTLKSGKLIRKSTLEQAFTGGNPTKDEHIKNYGYGWRIIKMYNDKQMIYHAGWWHGYNSLFVRLPDDDFTLIILTNKRTQLFFSNYKILLDELFPGAFRIEKNSFPINIDESFENDNPSGELDSLSIEL